ncbi:MAG: cyanophycinase [Polaromonas sp.]
MPYTYYSVGNPAAPVNVSRPASPSYVLMGGGPDVDEAFRWMIQQAGIKTGTGGRLVVVRASGDGAYDPYIYYSNKKSSISRGDILDGWVGGASYGLTSVETLVIPSIAAANDPYVNSVVSKANAVWIAGGDQSNYIKFWKGQALETTLNALMANNVPIGGTSAGLAVLGQFDYSALNASVTSPQALSNPYNADMTLDPVKTDGSLATMNGFIAPHALANTILDSHFDSRDRMGRLVTFVSRLVGNYAGSGTQQFGCTGGVLGNNAARGIGLGVETALLVKWDPSGYPSAHYTGQRVTNISTTTESAVYFVNVTQGPTLCASGKPLTVPTSAVEVRKLSDTTIINLSEWTRTFPTAYKYLGVTSGVLSDTNPY